MNSSSNNDPVIKSRQTAAMPRTTANRGWGRGAATVYVQLVNLLMLIFAAGLMQGVSKVFHGGELAALLIVFVVYLAGPVVLVLWIIGLFFLDYSNSGTKFYVGFGVTLIPAVLFIFFCM